MASTLRQRSVVSSFICKPAESPADFKVAIFKRSQDVSTYKGKWAACSGSIDPTDSSPEDAAKREIREETTLTDADISLFRRGKPFSLIDEGLKTEWTIHPFAWMLKPGAKEIVFDWEHTEYAFIAPGQIIDYDTVPNLDFGLGRCLVGPETRKALDALRDDHESGAQAMALSALDMLSNIIQRGDLAQVGERKEFWEQLRMVAWHLAKNGRPSMSPAIDAAILRTLKGIEMTTDCLGTQKEDSFADFTSYVNSTIEDCIRERRDSSDTLAKHFVEYVDGGLQTRESSAAFEIKFITVSASGTVLQCLVRLVWSLVSRNRTVKLSILESRPNFEGASFANALLNALEKSTGAGIVSEKGVELLRMNLRIEIVSDASVAMVVKDADYLLLGADKVLPTGDTNNKIGSLTAAVMATTLNPRCRVVSVFDTDKISGDANDPAHFQAEYNDETEIIRSWPWKIKTDFADKRDQGYKIDVKNAYFEWVPWKYIDCHISEKGVLAVEDIKRLSLERAALERKIFGDL